MCALSALGNARFNNFMDGLNATGRPMVVSTEPFSLHPNPAHRDFAHLWRTTNDINANCKSAGLAPWRALDFTCIPLPRCSGVCFV